MCPDDSLFTLGLAEAAGLLVVTALAAHGQGVLGRVLLVGAVRRFR